MTRYLHQEDVCNVYYGSRQNFGNKQPIELFHAYLNELHLIWINDPITSQRTRPTGIEMNQMLINALGYPSLLKDGNVRERHELYETKNQPLVELMTVLKDDLDEQRSFLSILPNPSCLALSSLDWVILTKKIAKLLTQNPHVLNYDGVSNNYDKYMLREYVDELEKVQQHHFDTYYQTFGKAHEIPIATDLIDLSELRNILNEFPATLKQYAVELEVDRKEHWENEENNQLVAMRANLSDYFVDAVGVSAEAKAICQKAIDTVDGQLQTVLHTKENVQQTKMQIQKMQSDIDEIADSVNDPLKSLDTVAQNYLVQKLKR